MQPPLTTRLTHCDPRRLTLGAAFRHVHYRWRPYHMRSPEARADYDRLRADLELAGQMTNPLIVYGDCVLIGQRRCEIALELGWLSVPCLEILEDITQDRTPDRVLALRDQYAPAPY